jgi:hypothetical protein
MTVNFFGVDVESVAHRCHNATHAAKIFPKRKPQGLVNPGATLEETFMKKLAPAITSEKSI